MSSSLTPKQVTENALREKAKLEAQVNCLQSQLGQLSSVKKKEFERQGVPTIKRSILDPKERKAIPIAPLVKEMKKEGHSGLEEVITLTLRSIFPSSKVNWTRIFSLIGYERLSEFLITKMSRMRRKSSLWPSSSKSMPPFGGLMLWPRDLEKGKPRSALGIK